MAPPQLTSYLDVRIPDTYWLDLVRGEHGWEPAVRLPMPHHHATRLELANADVLGDATRARVTIEITGREIRHDPARATWFVTYHARIVATQPG